MTKSNDPTTAVSEREYVMERVFNAPRELVFTAFSECKHLTQWWGPKGWTLPVCEMDFRPGGIWFYGMQGPPDDPRFAGVMAYGRADYRDIATPQLIVMLDQFADAAGNVDTSMPVGTVTVDFVEIDGRTLVIDTIRYASADELERVVATGMAQGATEAWDRLDALLASHPA